MKSESYHLVVVKNEHKKGEQMGTKLKLIRIEKGMTQRFVASKIGLTGSQLCNFERGKGRISAEALIKLCVLLDVDIRTLAD